MKLTEITIEGMHNVTRKTYQLSNLTYLHGPNGAGKSTVLQAIQLALLGYIPGTNKNKSEIFKHANSNTMSVTLKLLDGGTAVTVYRAWTKKWADITTQYRIDPAGYDLSEVLANIELPVFNFSEFLSLSANKMKDWFINFLPRTDVHVDWKTELTRALPLEYASELSDLVDSSVQEIAAFKLSGSEEIRKANEYFKSEVSFKKSEQTASQNTLDSLIHYSDIDESVSASDIFAELQQLNHLKSRYLDAVSVNQKNDDIQRRLDALNLAATHIEDDAEYRAISTKIEECQKLIDEETARVVTASHDREALLWQKYELQDEVALLNSNISQLTNITASNGVCPFSQLSCTDLQALIHSEISPKISDARTKISQLQSQNVTIDAQLAALDTTIAKSKASIDDLKVQISKHLADRRVIEDTYRSADNLRSLMTDRPTIPDVDITQLDAEIMNLTDLYAKHHANDEYNSLIDKLTAEKFRIEQELQAYKLWVKLTDVNGLQTSTGEDSPFTKLTDTMDEYISVVFGLNTYAHVNLESKANSFSFGIVRGGVYVPFTLLSSGEKCMVTLSLMCALVRISGTKLPLVLIDDLLDHLDDSNIQSLFAALQNVAGVQLVCAGVKSVEGDYVVDI